MKDTNPSRDSSDSDESEGDGGATASANENNSNILVQDDLQIREELPIQESRYITQETTVRETIIESILRANILQPHVDFSPQIEISPYDIDLGGMRGCLTCFQNPVTVQNWPCGCICNCGLCAMVMRVCAQCNGRIEGYTLKR